MKTRAHKTRRPSGHDGRKPSALELVHEGDRLLKEDGARAEDAYRRATRIDPHCSDAWTQLGCLMEDSRRYSEAVDCFRRVLDITHLGAAVRPDQAAEGKDAQQEAVDLLAQVAASRPNWARGQFSLGFAYDELGASGPARTHLTNALGLDASLEAAVESLFARMYCAEKKWTDALAAADRSLAANPNVFLAHIARASACSALGRMGEADASNRRAIEVAPQRESHSPLLFEMNFLEDTTPETLYAEACRWNSLYVAPLAARILPHGNVPDPDRRIKVGYVSPDLMNHAIMKFLPPVFERHDRSRYEVFVYAAGKHSDVLTEQVRQSVENFASIQDPDILSERVRADGIDILVDLAGHTMGPAYMAFALKPAPVQVSWLGSLSTTGMSTMDYFVGDSQMPCPGTEHLFTESVYRLPRVFCCYRSLGDVPIAPAPCLDRGYITFGSFNSPSKITRGVVKLWSAILHLVPESRLLIKYQNMETAVMQARFGPWFVEDGIPSERVQFAGSSRVLEYLAEFGRIDIALDPFPYNGGSTTLDALWMGVPVVTLAGRLAVQRTGASLLGAVGLADLVAQTPEQYLKIALYLAGVVAKEPDLRHDLRQALALSPLMDEVGLVRAVEDAYRNMWRAWCRTKN